MPKKRKIQQQSDSSESSTASENEEVENLASDAEAFSENEFDIEFDGSSPTEEDFHGMLNLLHQLFVTLRVSASPLVDKILAQNHIGSTLKIVDSDENEIYGITTGVVMEKGNAFFDDLKNALSKKMDSDPTSKASFISGLSGTKTLFMVNERFINVPIQLSAPLLSSLRNDLDAVEAAGKESKELEFQDIEQIMVVCKTLERVEHPEDAYDGAPSSSNSSTRKKKKRKKNHKSPTPNVKPTLEFVNAEEELFQKASMFQFSYSVVEATGLACGPTWQSDDAPSKTYRTVLLLPYQSLNRLIGDIEEFIGT